MRGVWTYLVVALVIIGASTPAWAYKAEPGNRAANFRGFDIVNRESIELDDYLGQWVFVEFWATWCGPCMRDLPKMLDATQPYVDSGELKVITINGDVEETYPELKRVLSELRIKCPVIYDPGIYDEFYYSIPALEWGVHAYPSTFLINPQGVIVANYMWGKNLGKLLDFYMSQHRPVMGVTATAKVHDDGKSVSIYANVMNQGMEDVELQLSAYLSKLLWDEAGVICGSEDISITHGSMTATLSFDEFSIATHEFVITSEEDWHTLEYSLWLAVPGAEEIAGRKGRGYELFYSADEFRLIDLVRIDGQWVVQQ